MAKLVSDVYGDALFELAVEEEKVDEFAQEAEAIITILHQSQELTQVMNHPKIIKEEKMEMIENIFTGRASKEIVGLMRMVVEKDHFAEMENIFTYFISRVMEYKNIGVAQITTPLELSDVQKKQVETRLLETTKYVAFRMEYAIDPELIGGMVIRIGDRVVDSSIKTQIAQLARELSKIQLKVGECAP